MPLSQTTHHPTKASISINSIKQSVRVNDMIKANIWTLHTQNTINSSLHLISQYNYRSAMSSNSRNNSHLNQLIAEDLEQSEILNQKFLELLQQKNEKSEVEHHQHIVDEDEEQKIKAQFQNIADGNDVINYQEFRDSLGLLGREDSFISRIFHLIDSDQDGLISIDDYVSYMVVILHGSEIQKQQFGWKIISGGRSQLGIKQLGELFEEISIVWNALTGEIVQPKRKYIEEMFTILDVDQDEAITFQDYRVLYQQQPFLFGWFEYLNNLNLNENTIKSQVQKTKNHLHDNNQLLSGVLNEKSSEQVQIFLENQQQVIDNKMINMIKQMKKTIKFGKQKLANPINISNHTRKEDNISKSAIEQQKNNLSTLSLVGKFYDRTSTTTNIKKSIMSNQEEDMSRLKRRKQKISLQHTKDTNIDMVKHLEQILVKCGRAMAACQQYRQIKQLQKRFSPTKKKLKQAKIQALYKNQEEKKKSQIGDQKKKKKNIMVYFGHENWNLVLNLMVGLRKSIRSLYQLNSYIQLKSSHFSQEHKFLLGNKTLKGKNKEAYQFYEIAPVAFQKLRNSYGISNLEYQTSVGPESLLNSLLIGNLTALNQKCSTGKSGSFFYLTLDNKIFLKTIPKHQFQFFTEIIDKYYKHQTQLTNTLIVRIYGLYKLHIYNNKELKEIIYFISMENIFKQIVGLSPNTLEIKQTYDLKGSLYGRSGEQGKQLKDNDWLQRKKSINLSSQLKQIFKNQIKVDSKFFKANNINDYSLMVAICQLDQNIWHEEMKKQQKRQNKDNIFKGYRGGILGDRPGQFYILCIIDILTVFQTKKNLQYIFKSTFLSKDVSCIPPAQYCKRFRNFMYKTVEQESEKQLHSQ